MRRGAAAALCIVVLGGLGLATVRYEVLQAINDRLATDYTIGDAQFSAPGLLVWPQLTQSGAIAACDVCSSAGSSGTDVSAEYGVLRSDPGMAGFFASQTSVAHSPRDVRLPQVVWILQWPIPDFCRDYPVEPYAKKCLSYELIDDATGWILDSGRNLTP